MKKENILKDISVDNLQKLIDKGVKITIIPEVHTLSTGEQLHQ